MPVITLTTDFGTGDDEAGVLHGVIWKICPAASIADLSHAVTRHNILEGALLLGRIAHYFPAGSIHVGVVDPGVGTSRRGIAAQLGAQTFVGPDNGLCTLMLERAEKAGEPIEIIELDNPEYWLPDVSNVFHGRDIFAPAAAHLACGLPLTRLGTRIDNPVRLAIPQPEVIPGGWRGRVLYIDAFGNLGTNLSGNLFGDRRDLQVKIAGKIIEGLVHAFGDRPSGELVALIDSSNYLSISLVNGNAAQALGIRPGDDFEVKNMNSDIP